ncbi:hypothetical protein BGZ82_003145, partial [Podila clonocystis]
ANSKKSRSTSSLGYPDSRYFILKSLSEEDLKLSVQYGVWATQDHLVPVLNDAFNTAKDVYLIFSANKSGEFFGYARMMGMISKELEDEMDAANSDKIWQPAIDLPLSPELKASMLVAVEEAEKEGKQISTEEAEKIAIASTTTKSWGIKFPIQWIHVHKVPFNRTARMYNPYYENREVKVSKDGTELEPSVGQQLMALFQKSNKRRGRGSTSGTASQSNSEAGGDSRRSSIAGDHPNTLMPNQGRGGSSRRSSVLSIKSTSSGAGERRGSHDPSQKQGSAPKSGFSSPRHSHRGQFGGDQSHYSGNRSNSRQNYSHTFHSQGATSPGDIHPTIIKIKVLIAKQDKVETQSLTKASISTRTMAIMLKAPYRQVRSKNVTLELSTRDLSAQDPAQVERKLQEAMDISGLVQWEGLQALILG